MMRHWIFIIALLLAGAARAENVLMKSNGLGLAAVGGIAVGAATAALSDPPAWQGYPKGDGGPQFANDAGVGQNIDGCAVREGSSIAKALKAPATDTAAEPDGQIRLSNPIRPAGEPVFDSKAIYQAGQPATCPGN